MIEFELKGISGVKLRWPSLEPRNIARTVTAFCGMDHTLLGWRNGILWRHYWITATSGWDTTSGTQCKRAEKDKIVKKAMIAYSISSNFEKIECKQTSL